MEGRPRLYADIAHPITSDCRDLIQQRVLEAYDEELVLAQLPGYISRYDDFGEEDFRPGGEDCWTPAEAGSETEAVSLTSPGMPGDRECRFTGGFGEGLF